MIGSNGTGHPKIKENTCQQLRRVGHWVHLQAPPPPPQRKAPKYTIIVVTATNMDFHPQDCAFPLSSQEAPMSSINTSGHRLVLHGHQSSRVPVQESLSFGPCVLCKGANPVPAQSWCAFMAGGRTHFCQQIESCNRRGGDACVSRYQAPVGVWDQFAWAYLPCVPACKSVPQPLVWVYLILCCWILLQHFLPCRSPTLPREE